MDEQPQAQASELKRLAERFAETKFGNEKGLSRAENLLLDKVSGGELAICGPNDNDEDKANDPKDADQWGPDRQIRAELIEWLCTNEQARSRVHARGIQVYGADVTGDLGLAFAAIPFQLRFRHCRLQGGIDLSAGDVPHLDLDGSLVHGISADGVIVKHNVFLRHGFTCNGEVRLPRAQIGGDLSCAGATLVNISRKVLDAEGATVKGNVFLTKDEKATPFTAKGEVNLNGAQIDGQLNCIGGHFSNPTGSALNAYRAIVKSSVFLRDGFVGDGRVYLVSAQIAGTFNCRDGNFQNATLDLTDASTGALYDSGLNDIPPGAPADSPPTKWPQPGKLLLDGFTYGRIFSKGQINVGKRLDWLGLQPQPPFRPQPYLQLAKVLRESGDDEGAKQVLIEMEDQLREGSPWGPVARPLLRYTIGYGYDPLRAFWWAAGLGALGWIIYRRSYLAGTMVPSDKDAYAEFKQAGGRIPPHYPRFSPLIYSMENSLPLVNLGQGDKWQPDPPGQGAPVQGRSATEFAYRAKWEWVPKKLRSAWQALLRRLAAMWARVPKSLRKGPVWISAKTTAPRFVMWFLWFQILLGWLLATLFVAGVSGIVHKE